MTQQQEHAFPYYRSADDIRCEDFSHRMRGLDEYEVREFLDLLADQLNATEKEREEYRGEDLQQAQEAAENAGRISGALNTDGDAQGRSSPVPEVQYTRTFTRVARIQLRSVVDALAEQADKLAEVPILTRDETAGPDDDEPMAAPAADSPQPERVYVYPQRRGGPRTR